jgi:hypothetical protein
VYIAGLVDFIPAYKSFCQVWFPRVDRARGF